MKLIMIAITAITISSIAIQSGLADPVGMATIPAKTIVPLILTQDLRSGKQHAGDAVTYETIGDVVGPGGAVLIPAGSAAHGVVKKSTGCGGFGKNGKLEITCDYVEAPDGSHVPFADPDFKKSGNRSQVATLLATPLILLPFSKGKDVTLHNGMVITMEVAADTPVKAASSASPSTLHVEVLEHGRHRKPFPATVRSFTAEAITFATDAGDRTVAVKNIEDVGVAR